MTVTRFDPFAELTRLQGRFGSLFGDVYLRPVAGDASAWMPAVDIYETEGHDFILKAELPDMSREDIELTVDKNVLTLKGTRKRSAEVKEEQYRRVERQYGAFTRSFALPSSVDATRVTADYRNGVLTVKLPFREESKPRSIPVEAAA